VLTVKTASMQGGWCLILFAEGPDRVAPEERIYPPPAGLLAASGKSGT